jgi:uncharacterized protein (TIGR02757 family)
VVKRDSIAELTYHTPDPLMVATRYKDEYISLICELFAYGKASQIVKFLDSLDFSLLNESENIIKKELKSYYYRFQNEQDVSEFFILMKRLKEFDSVENIFLRGYTKEGSIIDGLNSLITAIQKINSFSSHGYDQSC